MIFRIYLLLYMKQIVFFIFIFTATVMISCLESDNGFNRGDIHCKLKDSFNRTKLCCCENVSKESLLFHSNSYSIIGDESEKDSFSGFESTFILSVNKKNPFSTFHSLLKSVRLQI